MKKQNHKKRPVKKQVAKKINTTAQTKNSSIKHPQSASRKTKTQVKSVDFFEKYVGKWGWALCLVLLAGIASYIFRDYLSQKFIFMFNDIGSDSLNIRYPACKHDELLKKHGFADSYWSFYKGMGKKIGGEGSSDIISFVMNIPIQLLRMPFTLLSYLNNWDSLPHNIIFGQFSLIILTGFLFYLYLRTVGINVYSSAIGALLFAFSGYMVLGSTWYHTGGAFNFVLLLLAFEQFLKKKRWIFLPLAFYYLGGYRYFLYSIFLAIYATFRYFDENDRDYKGYLLFSLKAVGFALIGIGISSPGIIRSFMKMLASPRGAATLGDGGVGAVVTQTDPLKAFPVFGLETKEHYIAAIMRLFSNDLAGDGTNFNLYRNYLEAPAFYCGLITLLLIPQIFIHLNKRRKILFGAFTGLWIFVVIFPYFRYAFYAFAGDYYKQAMDYIVVLALLLPAVFSLYFISKSGKKVNLIVLIGTFVFLMILLYYPYFKTIKNPIDHDIQSSVRNFLILYAIILGLFNVAAIRKYIPLTLFVVVIFEVAFLGNTSIERRIAVTTENFNSKIGYNDYTVDAVQYLNEVDSSLFYRVEKSYSSTTAMHGSLNDAMIQDYFATSSYSSFNQINYIAFLQEVGIIPPGNEIMSRWAPGVKGRPLLMAFASVKYMLTKDDKSNYLKYGYKPVHKTGDVIILENPLYIPFGFCYDTYIPYSVFKTIPQKHIDKILLNAVVVDDSQDFYSKWTNNLQQYNVADTSQVLSWESINNDVNALRDEALQITQFEHDYIKGTIKTDKKQILFFTIPYDAGWTARIDGKPADLQQTNIGFLGFPVESGEHEIELEYVPMYTKAGFIVSWIFFIVYITLIILSLIVNREKIISKIRNTFGKSDNAIS